MCQPDIGYEFLGGAYLTWYDHGGFPHAPCDDEDPGFKFKNLQPDTSYVLSVRAYKVIAGAKVYSDVTSLTLSTLPGTAPTPTPTPSASPTPTSTPTATETPGDGISVPQLKGPTNKTSRSISVGVVRALESGGTCQPDIGYEFMGGALAGWYDHGGFGGSACTIPVPGFKFTGLMPDTSYVLSVRAYRIVDGAKVYSSVATLTATTLP